MWGWRTRAVLVVAGVAVVAATVLVHAATRPQDDAVSEHAARLGPFGVVHCDVRGTTAFGGRDGLPLHDCWMSRDARLGPDDEYACFVRLGDRVIDVTERVGGHPERPGCRSAPPPAAEVSRVTSGDTIVLDDGRRVRVALVDAPGVAGNRCFGLVARETLRALLPEGTPVGLRRAPPGAGGSGARVFRRGGEIGLELVRRGAAAPRLAPGARGEPARRLLRAARRARAARRGLWGTCPDTRLAPARPVATRRPAGIWVPLREVRRLPMAGRAWAEVEAAADELGRPDAWKLARPDVADLDSSHDVFTYAAALVAARTGDPGMRAKVLTALREAMNSARPAPFGALARGRNVPAYVFAADLIALRRRAPALDRRFRRWLRSILRREYRDGSIISNHEQHPNNHGTMTGGGRAAIAVYLGDAEELARTARVFRAWVGEGGGYDGLRFSRSLSWQGDPSRPLGINRKGARRRGVDVDGALPEEMRRGCPVRTPPCYSHYPWEGIGGALMQAELLHRQGYDAYAWGDRALLRAARFLVRLGRRDPRFTEGVLGGPHSWEPWLLNRRYGTHLPTGGPTDRGKNMGWTDWTHAPAA